MMNIPDKRPGHYVDGRYRYALTTPAQAQARARSAASAYGRPVTVYTRLAQDGEAKINVSLSCFWNLYAQTDSVDSPQPQA